MHREISPDQNDRSPIAEVAMPRDPGAAIAHELAQPLTAIINSLNAARRLLAGREGAENRLLREILNEALGQSQAATCLVRQLRDAPRRQRMAGGGLAGTTPPLPARSE